jgi:hypothetical protein
LLLFLLHGQACPLQQRSFVRGRRIPTVLDNGKEITELRRTAQLDNDATAKHNVSRWLLHVREDKPSITTKHEMNMSRSFLPKSPSKEISDQFGALEQPRPDTATGYFTSGRAFASSRGVCSFTEKEELTAQKYVLLFLIA